MENEDSNLNARVRNLVYTCPVDHDGTSVFVKGWLIPGASSNPIVLVHDIGETVESLEPFAMSLATAGYSVYGFDMRGHGQSDQKLGRALNFKQLTSDLLQVVAWVKHKESGKKPIVIAQGIGALVSLFFARGYGKISDAMVFASPIFSLSENITPFRRFILKSLADFFPSMNLPHSLCPTFTHMTDKRNPEKRRSSKSSIKISAQFAYELLNAISQSRKLFQRHRLKSLILCPKEDQVCKYEFLKRQILKHQFNKDLCLKFIESSQHRILSSDHDSIEQSSYEIKQWLNQRSKPAPETSQNTKDTQEKKPPVKSNRDAENGTEASHQHI